VDATLPRARRQGLPAALGRWLAPLLACTLACASAPIREAKPLDRTVLVTLDDVRAIGYSIAPRFDAFEDITRSRPAPGALEILYEFDPPEDAGIPLYLYAEAQIRPSGEAAMDAYEADSASRWARERGLELRVGDDWLRYGDASRAGFAYVGETPFALVFETLSGVRVFRVVVAGPVFDDLETWRQVILRRLTALEAMSAEGGA